MHTYPNERNKMKMNAATTVPLAPPAPTGPVAPRHNKHASAPFQWTSWLSPKAKAAPTHRHEERHAAVESNNSTSRIDGSSDSGDCHDCDGHHRSRVRRQQQQRPRAASSDQTPNTSPVRAATGRLNQERGGQSYFTNNASSTHGVASSYGRSSLDGKAAKGIFDAYTTDDHMGLMMSVSLSRSTDDSLEDYSSRRHSSGSSVYHQNSTSGSSGISNKSSNNHSLLTAFLLHLNSLLPVYCNHLSSATFDTLHSITAASEAVSVLERGAKTVSIAFGPTASSSDGAWPSPKSPTVKQSPTMSSAPSSPSCQLNLNTNNNDPSRKKYFLTPRSDAASGNTSPTKSSLLGPDLRHWLSPLSPRSTERKNKSKTKTSLSPIRGYSSQRASSLSSSAGTKKWSTSIAESEWERFVSPFLMLAGAECLYGRMDHVLDPKVSTLGRDDGEALASSHDKKAEEPKSDGGSSCFVKFAQGHPAGSGTSFIPNTPTSPPPASMVVPPTPTPDANKRGSRRLTAMYRQIREDLIIVGEYLCDPVLGAHVVGGGSNATASSSTGDASKQQNGKRDSRLPPPPLDLDASSSSSPRPQSSPAKKSSGDESQTNNGKCTPYEQREIAAISLRSTLDALISFIDARCVLIRIHAELCCAPLPPPIPSLGLSGGDRSMGGGKGKGNNNNNSNKSQKNNSFSGIGGRNNSGSKWMAFADQCRTVMDPVSAWAKEEEQCWRAVSNVEKELKAMELALTSIHYLYDCNLFNCMLNVRRLHVLLRKIDNVQMCIPIMYIRSSLPDILAMMHVYFHDQSLSLNLSPTPRSIQSNTSGLPPNRKSLDKLGDVINAKSPPGKSRNIFDFNSLFAEFVGRCKNGAPLAVVVAHETGDKKDTAPLEKRHNDVSEGDKEGSDEESSSWEPLYMKSNIEDNISAVKRRSQEPHNNNIVRIIKENFSNDREVDRGETKRDANADKYLDLAKKWNRMGNNWPFNNWSQIERVLTNHCSERVTSHLTKCYIKAVGTERNLPNNAANGKNQHQSSSSNSSIVTSNCHISSITDSICLLIIQDVGNSKRQKVSDDEIIQFMRSMVSNLSPESVMSVKAVMSLKSELFDTQDNQPPSHHSKVSTPPSNDNIPTSTSLWSESSWSDTQRKQILHSLGLRRKHSPVMAPLKSPYVKRQIRKTGGRQRKKKVKKSINNAHLDFFLGPELSQLL
mmetsp:Transcript_34965/g.73761  ORF Transcript_34965/g.73761 Transcript_34965/m.73761 type:complete len:1197 (+) Transcript_34965:51-3641(+)